MQSCNKCFARYHVSETHYIYKNARLKLIRALTICVTYRNDCFNLYPKLGIIMYPNLNTLHVPLLIGRRGQRKQCRPGPDAVKRGVWSGLYCLSLIQRALDAPKGGRMAIQISGRVNRVSANTWGKYGIADRTELSFKADDKLGRFNKRQIDTFFFLQKIGLTLYAYCMKCQNLISGEKGRKNILKCRLLKFYPAC